MKERQGQVIGAPARIGILGGGQLGAMLCEAGRRMGYEMRVLSPSRADPAARWADEHVEGDTGDAATVEAFARGVEVLTNEFEQVPPEVLEAAEALGTCRVAPGPGVQRTCRDRREEKRLFARLGVPHGAFAIVEAAGGMAGAYEELGGGSVVVKAARGGYDGKGQVWVRSAEAASGTWEALGGEAVVMERGVEFVAEGSVIVARNGRGEMATFPMFRNEHRGGILHQTVIPAGFSGETEAAARGHARAIAEELGVVGLLAVEMFVLGNGELRMNELAARPHNSGHVTERATARSQFELHIAAICGLPLGGGAVNEVGMLSAGVMTNLLGDLWGEEGGREPGWVKVFEEGTGTLHLYGKEPRPGRKMGHMIHTGGSASEVLAAADRVYGGLAGGS